MEKWTDCEKLKINIAPRTMEIGTIKFSQIKTQYSSSIYCKLLQISIKFSSFLNYWLFGNGNAAHLSISTCSVILYGGLRIRIIKGTKKPNKF